MNITFRKLIDTDKEYEQLYEWCKNKFVYEWFEQRVLSLKEITNKYRNKFLKKEQDLLVIQCDNKDIGLVQIYKFINDYNIKVSGNIYEYDLYIGIEEYLSKGIGTIIVKKINDIIYNEYKADSIILRPFKRNIRAIKCYEKCGYRMIDEYEGKDTLGNPEAIEVLINER